MATKVWSLKGVSFTYGGLGPSADELSDDDCIVVEYDDSASQTRGAGGGSVINILPGGIKAVRLRLLQTSTFNATLSAMHAVQATASDGTGLAPLSVIDTNGSTVIVAATAAIQKLPDWTAGKEVKMLEWAFVAADDVSFIGGH